MKHPYFNQYKFKYLEWNDSDIIHEATLMWISQLEFIEVEQLFLEELLTENTLGLLADKGFDMAKHLATDLANRRKQLQELLALVKEHRNNNLAIRDEIYEIDK